MKTYIRTWVQKILQRRADSVLQNAEVIIGITGSVGKSSTRMAIAQVLKKKYSVSTSKHNFNTPLGLLLSLVGVDQSGYSICSWIRVLLAAFFRPPPSSQVLVLEYGIDAPGDMDRLLEVAKPDIVVLSPVSLAHTGAGQFHNVEDIREEKLKLALAAKEKIIANGFDAPTVADIQKKAKKPLLVFGSSKNADVMIHYQETNTHGIHFTVDEEEFSARVFGEFQPQIFAPAIILGKEMNVNMQDIKNAIAEYEPPAGRGRIFLGKNGSTLWDFSYNCSPSAASAALRSLADVPGFSRRIALLGNMNELGEHTHKEHKKIGSLAEKYADVIIFVGKESEAFTTGIHDKKKVRICTNAKKAAQFLQDMVQENDLILVKGSQNGVFLEEAVKMLLEKKENVARLCRQSKHWEKVRRMYFESHKV